MREPGGQPGDDDAELFALWLSAVGKSSATGEFLQMLALGFVLCRIVRDPRPFLAELERANDAMAAALLAAQRDLADDVVSGDVWPEGVTEE